MTLTLQRKRLGHSPCACIEANESHAGPERPETRALLILGQPLRRAVETIRKRRPGNAGTNILSPETAA